MKLGAGTYGWSAAGYGMEDALREIAALGIGYVDMLGCGHGHPEVLTKSKREDIVRIIDDHDLHISSILALHDGNIASPERQERADILDYMHRIFDLCGEFAADQILYKPGDKVIGLPHDAAWENSVAFTQRTADVGRGYGVLITFELVPRPFALVQTIAEMELMLDDVACENVFANLDLGHVALVRDGAADCARIASRTIHLHLNDNDTYVHTNDVVGSGNVPTEAYVEAVCENGAEETCASLGITLVAGIEIELTEKTEGKTPRDITRMSRDYVRDHVPSITM